MLLISFTIKCLQPCIHFFPPLILFPSYTRAIALFVFLSPTREYRVCNWNCGDSAASNEFYSFKITIHFIRPISIFLCW